jgi:hypothetical protein
MLPLNQNQLLYVCCRSTRTTYCTYAAAQPEPTTVGMLQLSYQ